MMAGLAADMNGGVFALLIPVALLIAAANFVWRSTREVTVLQRWAARQGVQLIHYEERRLARGPFFFSTAKGQVVYRITVGFADGRTATGWARSGSWLTGLLSDDVKVRWDKEKPLLHGFPVILPGAGGASAASSSSETDEIESLGWPE